MGNEEVRRPFRVLVVGDVMVDRYLYAKTTRMAPEDPRLPIWDEVRRESRLGGAANAALNLKSLGGDEVDVTVAGIFDNDEAAWLIALSGMDHIGSWGKTMTKDRVVDESGRIIFRINNFNKFGENYISFFSSHVENIIGYNSFDAVLVSDYDKGTITPRIARLVRQFPLCVVDSKRKDLSIFKGYDVLKVNETEYADQVSSPFYQPFEGLFKNVVVTLGSKGAQLRIYDPSLSDVKKWCIHAEDFPVEPVKNPVDVTGCGDTHTAAMVFSLLKTGDLRWAVKFANRCARAKVQKFGTGPVTLKEIE